MHISDRNTKNSLFILIKECEAERIWQTTINEKPTNNIMLDRLLNRVETFDYGQKGEFNAKFLFTLKMRDETGQNMLATNYSQLNFDLLMNIIESRQKILVQRLVFQNDLNEVFVADDNYTCNDDDNLNEGIST